MDLRFIQDSIDRHGLQATFHDLALRTVNKAVEATILKGIALSMHSVDPAFAEDDAGLRWGFVGRDALVEALPRGAGEDMDEAFIDQALSRGDRCYGAFDGDILASYGWYSTRPTPVNHELTLHFHPSYAYMYKGYTLPAYRGRRLHGIGMARAMKAHVDEGLAGLVSYVKSNNHASLKSCYRLGYEDFGKIYVVKLRGRYRTYATKGCARYGFRVEPVKP